MASSSLAAVELPVLLAHSVERLLDLPLRGVPCHLEARTRGSVQDARIVHDATIATSAVYISSLFTFIASAVYISSLFTFTASPRR